MINSVIFDFNGTLVQDTHLHNLAWQGFFKKYGLAVPDEKAMFHLHGKTNKDILSLFFTPEMPAAEMLELSREKEDLYRRLFIERQVGFIQGAVALFEWLQQQKIPFTIATASDEENVNFYFDYLRLGEYFDRSKVVYNDGSIPGKPDPELFLRAIRNLGVTASEVLIFEDSFNGIRAAENAGAGKIVIVDSHGEDYAAWDYPTILTFSDFDRTVFKH